MQKYAAVVLRASPPCRRKACSWKALWRAPSLQPNFLPRHSPTIVCFLSLHIEKVSWIFHVALTQVVEGKKNPQFGHNKEQRLPARIVSGAGSLKSPGSLKSGIGEGWGMFFSKATSKGLPRPFNTAGWRCSKRSLGMYKILLILRLRWSWLMALFNAWAMKVMCWRIESTFRSYNSQS